MPNKSRESNLIHPPPAQRECRARGPSFEKEKRKSDRKDFFFPSFSKQKIMEKKIICCTVKDSGRNNINTALMQLTNHLNFTVSTPLRHTSALKMHAAGAKLREKPAATMQNQAQMARTMRSANGSSTVPAKLIMGPKGIRAADDLGERLYCSSTRAQEAARAA
jgi:hypothetical protein